MQNSAAGMEMSTDYVVNDTLLAKIMVGHIANLSEFSNLQITSSL